MAIIRASENDVKRIFELIKNRFGNVNNTADASKNVASAEKLTTARTIRTNLGSTSTVGFDGTENVTPGVSGTLPIANGGTGATSAAGVLTNLGITATAAELNKLDGVTATATEINYLDGVTSNIQTQLNGKLPATGTAAKATADASGQNIADTYIKSLSVNGRTITYTKGDGGTGTITTQDTNTTYSTFKGATSSAAGGTGLVPAPAAGAQSKFLRADGTWQIPTNTTYGAAGDSLGLVKSGGDVTISGGVITVNDDSHNHTIANVDGLQAKLNNLTLDEDGALSDTD